MVFHVSFGECNMTSVSPIMEKNMGRNMESQNGNWALNPKHRNPKPYKPYILSPRLVSTRIHQQSASAAEFSRCTSANSKERYTQGIRDQGLGFRGLGFRVWGSGFRVSGLGFGARDMCGVL